MARVFFISDIHGMYDELMEVFEKANVDYENDVVICGGDVCDRGLKTFEVIEELLKIKNLISLKGNHDDWLYTHAITGHHPAIEYFRETAESYYKNANEYPETSLSARYASIPHSHYNFLSNQKLYYIDDQNRLFVHAGLILDMKIEDQDDSEFYWNRDLARKAMSCGPGDKLNDVNGFKRIFIGHTPTVNWGKGGKNITTPIYKGQIVLCDTGACFGGKLTLMDVTDDENHIIYQSN